MSTYNGYKYLSEQIESILAQNLGENEISMLIRDDGSTDKGLTIGLIKSYSDKYPEKISYYRGSNLGACGSFFDLTQNADLTCDYFGFADQDDFWLPNKVQRGIIKLEKVNSQIPTVYSTQITVVDENLKKIDNSKGKVAIMVSFGNSLLENIVTGCTAIFNKAMLMELRKVRFENVREGLFLHDWTLYMIASSYGRLIYDKKSYILYRQHDSNVLGAERGKISKIVRKLKLFMKYKSSDLITKNIRAFYKVYGEKLNENEQYFIQKYVEKNSSIIKCLKVILDKEIKRQKLSDTIIFKAMMIFKII